MFTKQAYYESEKAKLATGLTDLARSEGWEYKAPMVNGKYASPEMIQAHYGSQQKLQLERQASEQWYKSNNLPLPENWNTLTPQERVITKGKSENDLAYTTAINTLLEAYPEVKSRLPKDFSSKPLPAQKAIVDRVIPEWKEEIQYNVSLARSRSQGGGTGGGSSSGGGAGDGMLASTFSQSSGALSSQKEAKLALDTLYKDGVMFEIGTWKTKKKIRVAVRQAKDGRIGYYFADGSKLLNVKDKKTGKISTWYYDPAGNITPKVPVDKTSAINQAQDYFNTLKNKYQVATDEVTRTQTGLAKSGNNVDPFAQFSIGSFEVQ